MVGYRNILPNDSDNIYFLIKSPDCRTPEPEGRDAIDAKDASNTRG